MGNRKQFRLFWANVKLALAYFKLFWPDWFRPGSAGDLNGAAQYLEACSQKWSADGVLAKKTAYAEVPGPPRPGPFRYLKSAYASAKSCCNPTQSLVFLG
eukprot:3940068-Rhodomonas_salina.1